MNRLKKLVLASTLAFTMVTTTAIAPMALTFGTSPYKAAAKQYAQDVKTVVKDTGALYEDLTESYPDNAVQNPDAAVEYVESAVDFGLDFLSQMSSLSKAFAFGK